MARSFLIHAQAPPERLELPTYAFGVVITPVLRSWAGRVCQRVRPPFWGWVMAKKAQVPVLQNTDAEEALLGAILVSPPVLEGETVGEVKSSHFSIVRHR